MLAESTVEKSGEQTPQGLHTQDMTLDQSLAPVLSSVEEVASNRSESVQSSQSDGRNRVTEVHLNSSPSAGGLKGSKPSVTDSSHLQDATVSSHSRSGSSSGSGSGSGSYSTGDSGHSNEDGGSFKSRSGSAEHSHGNGDAPPPSAFDSTVTPEIMQQLANANLDTSNISVVSIVQDNSEAVAAPTLEDEEFGYVDGGDNTYDAVAEIEMSQNVLTHCTQQHGGYRVDVWTGHSSVPATASHQIEDTGVDSRAAGGFEEVYTQEDIEREAARMKEHVKESQMEALRHSEQQRDGTDAAPAGGVRGNDEGATSDYDSYSYYSDYTSSYSYDGTDENSFDENDDDDGDAPRIDIIDGEGHGRTVEDILYGIPRAGSAHRPSRRQAQRVSSSPHRLSDIKESIQRDSDADSSEFDVENDGDHNADNELNSHEPELSEKRPIAPAGYKAVHVDPMQTPILPADVTEEGDEDEENEDMFSAPSSVVNDSRQKDSEPAKVDVSTENSPIVPAVAAATPETETTDGKSEEKPTASPTAEPAPETTTAMAAAGAEPAPTTATATASPEAKADEAASAAGSGAPPPPPTAEGVPATAAPAGETKASAAPATAATTSAEAAKDAKVVQEKTGAFCSFCTTSTKETAPGTKQEKADKKNKEKEEKKKKKEKEEKEKATAKAEKAKAKAEKEKAKADKDAVSKSKKEKTEKENKKKKDVKNGAKDEQTPKKKESVLGKFKHTVQSAMHHNQKSKYHNIEGDGGEAPHAAAPAAAKADEGPKQAAAKPKSPAAKEAESHEPIESTAAPPTPVPKDAAQPAASTEAAAQRATGAEQPVDSPPQKSKETPQVAVESSSAAAPSPTTAQTEPAHEKSPSAAATPGNNAGVSTPSVQSSRQHRSRRHHKSAPAPPAATTTNTTVVVVMMDKAKENSGPETRQYRALSPIGDDADNGSRPNSSRGKRPTKNPRDVGIASTSDRVDEEVERESSNQRRHRRHRPRGDGTSKVDPSVKGKEPAWSDVD